MWREASILLSFAVGMTLVYAGLERLLARRRRAPLTRAALTGVALALLGALAVYAGFHRLTHQ